MAVKRIEVFKGLTTVCDCRLYSDDFRKLFQLPIRKGKILSLKLVGQTINVRFEIPGYKYIDHKLTGGK
jgi:hypothetical protein